ncbi:MAG: N-6 DNA methylase, partial [candidate division WOR-3 bacterium]
HDLLGRLFHDLLPHDTRKLLAAYYTRPQSAELLAALTIDRWDERVIDPACGSGTLLVSAYRRKKTLAPKTIHEDDIHKRFIAEEIYGIDIMPFAAHLTALNLASQNIDMVTDETMTGVADSLFDIKGGYVRLSATKMGELFNYSIEKRTPNKKGDMEVRLYDFDTVIMNPPFTKKERIPAGYRSKIAKEWKDWGLEVGLWGPFLGVARLLAREQGGKIGAVIPIAFLRGRESARVRNNLIGEASNLRIRYIVKPVGNFAFSESSAYRDILLVLENNSEKTHTGIVFITANLRDITVEDAERLGKKIRAIPEGTEHEERGFAIYWVNHEELFGLRENLMPLVSVVKGYNRKLFRDVIRKINASPLTEPFGEDEFLEGYPPRPKGISRFIFITRPLDESRLKQAGLILRKETASNVEAELKTTGKILSFPKGALLPSLRTITGVRRIDISELHDYLVIKDCAQVREAARFSGFSGEIPWGKIRQEARAAKTSAVIVLRMRWDSPSNSLVAALSQDEFYPSNNLEVLRHTGDRAKMSVLFLNSVFFMLQLYYIGEATTENFIDIRIHDLLLIKRPIWSKLPKKAKERLLELWEEVKDYEFPCILDQLKDRDTARLKIDEAFAEILGLKVKLENLYDALVEEIELNRAFRKEEGKPDA